MPSLQNIQEPFSYNPRAPKIPDFYNRKNNKRKKWEISPWLPVWKRICCSIFHALLQRLDKLKRRKQINLDEFYYQKAKENPIIYTNSPTSSAFFSSKRRELLLNKNKKQYAIDASIAWIKIQSFHSKTKQHRDSWPISPANMQNLC